MPFATSSDVAIYVPDLEQDELADTIETLLEQAEAELLLTFPDLVERVGDGRTQLVHVKRVESEMVSSVLRNPNAWTSESETVGGLSSSHGISVAVASGLLQLTETHVRLIRGLPTVGVGSGTASGGMFIMQFEL